jgi:hypothetical protein
MLISIATLSARRQTRLRAVTGIGHMMARRAKAMIRESGSLKTEYDSDNM